MMGKLKQMPNILGSPETLINECHIIAKCLTAVKSHETMEWKGDQSGLILQQLKEPWGVGRTLVGMTNDGLMTSIGGW